MKQRIALFLFSLLVLIPLVYVFGTGIMEARNLISAQSMALDGDWLIPHLFTEIRLNKPPLPVWLTAPVFLLDPSPSLFALHMPVILVTALLGQQFGQHGVYFFKVRAVRFTCDRPVSWTLDGEDGGSLETVSIACVPGAVTFAVGKRPEWKVETVAMLESPPAETDGSVG